MMYGEEELKGFIHELSEFNSNLTQQHQDRDTNRLLSLCHLYISILSQRSSVLLQRDFLQVQ